MIARARGNVAKFTSAFGYAVRFANAAKASGKKAC